MVPAETAESGARQVYTLQEGRPMIKKLKKKKKRYLGRHRNERQHTDGGRRAMPAGALLGLPGLPGRGALKRQVRGRSGSAPAGSARCPRLLRAAAAGGGAALSRAPVEISPSVAGSSAEETTAKAARPRRVRLPFVPARRYVQLHPRPARLPRGAQAGHHRQRAGGARLPSGRLATPASLAAPLETRGGDAAAVH